MLPLCRKAWCLPADAILAASNSGFCLRACRWSYTGYRPYANVTLDLLEGYRRKVPEDQQPQSLPAPEREYDPLVGDALEVGGEQRSGAGACCCGRTRGSSPYRGRCARQCGGGGKGEWASGLPSGMRVACDVRTACKPQVIYSWLYWRIPYTRGPPEGEDDSSSGSSGSSSGGTSQSSSGAAAAQAKQKSKARRKEAVDKEAPQAEEAAAEQQVEATEATAEQPDNSREADAEQAEEAKEAADKPAETVTAEKPVEGQEAEAAA